jgi:PPOX class probable F420-dependent enzyme
MLGTEAKQVVTSNALAHLVTLNPDGSPHVTLAWAGLDGDEIVMATLPDQRKLKNMRRDPRVAVSFETDRVNSFGLKEYLVVHGRARVVPGGAPELLQELAYVYIGPGTKFPPMPDPPPGFVTRIAVESVAGVGPWTG